MRKYQEIWERLKKLDTNTARTVGISITTNPALHARIIKAVKKEKWKDRVYKLTIEPRTSILTAFISDNIITFKLDLSVLDGDF